MRDKTYPVQVSFSDSLSGLAVLISGQEFKTQRKTKVRTRQLNFLYYFDLVVSGPGSRTICTVRPSPSLSTSVTSSLSSPIHTLITDFSIRSATEKRTF